MLSYIVLTVGIWMFLYSYSNSYNRLTEDKITPASFVITENKADLKILSQSYELSLERISPENRSYLILYLLTPDELRAELVLLTGGGIDIFIPRLSEESGIFHIPHRGSS